MDSESSETASRSLEGHAPSRHGRHEDESEQEVHETVSTQGHGKPHRLNHHHNDDALVAVTALASASLSRNASGNLRDTQFERLLEKEFIDLDQLRKLSWGGVPTKHRPTVWRLLLV